MNKTDIEWCDRTWNPVTGCFHKCPYCYAKNEATRFGGYWSKEHLRHFGGNGTIHEISERMIRHTKGKNRDIPVHDVVAPFPYVFDPTFHKYRLDEPQRVKKPQNIFICSMADLFGDWVPDEWIQQVFEACEKAPQHRYLFLTKNPQRYYKVLKENMSNNMWFGATHTTPDVKNWDSERNWNTFVSIEPIQANFPDFNPKADWFILGSETGNRKGKVTPDREWIENIVNKCRAQNVPVFMKDSLAPIWGEKLIQEYPW